MNEREEAKPKRQRIGGPKNNTSLYLGTEIQRKLTEKAKREGTSVSALVRLACEKSLAASAAPESED